MFRLQTHFTDIFTGLKNESPKPAKPVLINSEGSLTRCTEPDTSICHDSTSKCLILMS